MERASKKPGEDSPLGEDIQYEVNNFDLLVTWTSGGSFLKFLFVIYCYFHVAQNTIFLSIYRV